MTAVERYQPPGPDTAPAVHTTQVTDLVAWAAQADAAYRYAEIVCATEFCPAQYRKKPYEAAAAILAGGELGFSPMASLRTFDNIQGVASPKAITQRAVVQSHGHEMWTVEKSATRCVVQGHRKGSDKVQESVWTIERAELAGFVKKNPNYKTQPESMLLARATSECARMIASDALLGIPYSSEELQDDASLHERHPDERRALPSPRAAVRGGTSTASADLTGTPTIDAAVDTAMIDREQSKAIGDAFKAAGVTDRAARARIVDSLVDRPVKSAADLTHAEAAQLVANLAEMGPDDIAALAEVPQAPAKTDAGDADEHLDATEQGGMWPEVAPAGSGADQ